MKKFEITFSREITSKVVIERETLAEAIDVVTFGFSELRPNQVQVEETTGKPIIKAVVEVNNKQRLNEG